ncbi:hypothetical protein EDB92DRAFT_1949740 [Lactarius akahatsu]|uniref:Uncharacterized protein n=1 Tax=Lactarius akahatsu TaxID=416441 RepID=A0AAD4LDS0_9AGAM|nr:hypothetical protein EDB92DRAFT_1949740 [Lactarius akahatsu]
MYALSLSSSLGSTTTIQKQVACTNPGDPWVICTVNVLTSCIIPEISRSEDDDRAHNVPEGVPDSDEHEHDEELKPSLDDIQPVLSLQTADDVDLEMDADLQEHVEALDEGLTTQT